MNKYLFLKNLLLYIVCLFILIIEIVYTKIDDINTLKTKNKQNNRYLQANSGDRCICDQKNSGRTPSKTPSNTRLLLSVNNNNNNNNNKNYLSRKRKLQFPPPLNNNDNNNNPPKFPPDSNDNNLFNENEIIVDCYEEPEYCDSINCSKLDKSNCLRKCFPNIDSSTCCKIHQDLCIFCDEFDDIDCETEASFAVRYEVLDCDPFDPNCNNPFPNDSSSEDIKDRNADIKPGCNWLDTTCKSTKPGCPFREDCNSPCDYVEDPQCANKICNPSKGEVCKCNYLNINIKECCVKDAPEYPKCCLGDDINCSSPEDNSINDSTSQTNNNLDNENNNQTIESSDKSSINNNSDDISNYNGTIDENGFCVCDAICSDEQEEYFDEVSQERKCRNKQSSNNQDDANSQNVNNNNNNNSDGPTTEINDPCKFMECIPKQADLLYSIMLINKDVTLPDLNVLGTYEINSNESNNEIDLKDLFKLKWTSNEYITTNKAQLRLKENIIPKLKNLYYKEHDRGYTFLTKNKTNEIGFISMNIESCKMYLKNMISLLYNNSTITIDKQYDETLFNGDSFIFPDDPNSVLKSLPRVASLGGSTDIYEYGFSYNKCPRMMNWKNYALNLDMYKEHFKTDKKITDIIKKFNKIAMKLSIEENKSKNKEIKEEEKGIQFNKEGDINIDMRLDNLINNFNLTETISKLFIADYSYDDNHMKKISEGLSLDDVKSLYNFFLYDINTYSMLHTYISIQPFFKRIESIFLDIINGKTEDLSYPKNSKMLIYCVDETVFASFYKIINYDKSKSKNEFYYKRDNIKYIDYNYNIQFELWKDKSIVPNKYYVSLRNNMMLGNQTIEFSKEFSKFQSDWLSKFYNSIGFDAKEREYFCGL